MTKTQQYFADREKPEKPMTGTELLLVGGALLLGGLFAWEVGKGHKRDGDDKWDDVTAA